MDEEIIITRSKLIAALAQWESESKTKNFQPRTDNDRHADTADYLLRLMGAE
jgi:hypothetical protein